MIERLTRRQFLKIGAAASVAPYIARLSRGITPAPPPQHLWENPPDIEVFGKLIQVKTFAGGRQVVESTPESEISKMPYQKREELPGNLVRLEFASRFPLRPHVVVAEINGDAQFVRQTLMNERGAPIAFMPSGYFYTIPIRTNYDRAPEFYKTYSSPPGSLHRSQAIATEVSPQSGFAQVTEKDRPGRGDIDVYERQYFKPLSSKDAYYRKWGRLGDYQKLRSALITVDGLGSKSTDRPFEAFDDALSLYDEVIPFKYTEWDIYKMAKKLADDIDDAVNQGFNLIHFLGYSLGSVIVGQYAIENILAATGRHRDGLVGAMALLAGPIHGVPEAKLSYVFSEMLGEDFILGNNAANTLAFWGSSDARKMQNEVDFQKLIQEQKVAVMLTTNADDCFTTPEATTLPNISQVLSMGRGQRGIPDCDSIFMAPFLGGDVIENLGHSQVKYDPRVISQVTNFFRSQL